MASTLHSRDLCDVCCRTNSESLRVHQRERKLKLEYSFFFLQTFFSLCLSAVALDCRWDKFTGLSLLSTSFGRKSINLVTLKTSSSFNWRLNSSAISSGIIFMRTGQSQLPYESETTPTAFSHALVLHIHHTDCAAL